MKNLPLEHGQPPPAGRATRHRNHIPPEHRSEVLGSFIDEDAVVVEAPVGLSQLIEDIVAGGTPGFEKLEGGIGERVRPFVWNRNHQATRHSERE